jgi:hypothetical protein
MKYFKVLINERYSYISYNTNTTYLQIFFNKVSMYGWWTKKTGAKMTTIQIEIWQICAV